MPELPEVETTRRGLVGFLEGDQLIDTLVRNPSLRWPVPMPLPDALRGRRLCSISRRSKYLLFDFEGVGMLVHLGMSGSLRILSDPTSALRKHDHLVWTFARAGRLCLHDPRRFGAVLLLDSQGQHPLLKRLGPEPLSADFTVDVLHAACKGRRQAIKVRIMDASVVVGVGNIYAQEALFMAGIDPRRQAGRISRERLEGLRDSIRTVLQQAVDTGGTTLRDFVNPEGQPGYFAQSLMVYGRGGGACYRCGSRLASTRVAGRTTCWCPSCQT